MRAGSLPPRGEPETTAILGRAVPTRCLARALSDGLNHRTRESEAPPAAGTEQPPPYALVPARVREAKAHDPDRGKAPALDREALAKRCLEPAPLDGMLTHRLRTTNYYNFTYR